MTSRVKGQREREKGEITKGGDLPEKNAEGPDVRLGGEYTVSDRLRGHPLERQSAVCQLEILVACTIDNLRIFIFTTKVEQQ